MMLIDKKSASTKLCSCWLLKIRSMDRQPSKTQISILAFCTTFNLSPKNSFPHPIKLILMFQLHFPIREYSNNLAILACPTSSTFGTCILTTITSTSWECSNNWLHSSSRPCPWQMGTMILHPEWIPAVPVLPPKHEQKRNQGMAMAMDPTHRLHLDLSHTVLNTVMHLNISGNGSLHGEGKNSEQLDRYKQITIVTGSQLPEYWTLALGEPSKHYGLWMHIQTGGAICKGFCKIRVIYSFLQSSVLCIGLMVLFSFWLLYFVDWVSVSLSIFPI